MLINGVIVLLHKAEVLLYHDDHVVILWLPFSHRVVILQFLYY